MVAGDVSHFETGNMVDEGMNTVKVDGTGLGRNDDQNNDGNGEEINRIDDVQDGSTGTYYTACGNENTGMGRGQSPIDPAPMMEIKLFVGRVPRTWDVDQLRPVFETFGEVSELVIIRDKSTRQHKGSAFVRMASIYQGDAAIRELNGKRSLDPSVGLLQVKYAQGELSRLGMEQIGETTVSSVKLFVGSIPRNTNENKVKEVFRNYGQVEEVFILRNNQTNESKGCCFVKMAYKEQALYSMRELDGKYTMDGCIRSLEVRFAHNKTVAGSPPNQPASHFCPPPNRASPWREYYTHDGQPYYHNEITNVTTWHRPDDFPPLPLTPGVRPMHPDAIDEEAIANSAATGPPGSNLFVFHVPNEWEDKQLIHAFSSCGQLVSARIARDKPTGRNKGYGFVSFTSPEAASLAIRQLHGFFAHGKRLKVAVKNGEDAFLHKNTKSEEDKKSSKSSATTKNSNNHANDQSNTQIDYSQQSYGRNNPTRSYNNGPHQCVTNPNMYVPSSQIHYASSNDQVSQYSTPITPNYTSNITSGHEQSYYTTANVGTSQNQPTYSAHNVNTQSISQTNNPYTQPRNTPVTSYVSDTSIVSNPVSQATSASATQAAANPYSQSYTSTYASFRNASVGQYGSFTQNPYANTIQPAAQAAQFAGKTSHIIPNTNPAGSYSTIYHNNLANYSSNPRNDTSNYEKDRNKDRHDVNRKFSPY